MSPGRQHTLGEEKDHLAGQCLRLFFVMMPSLAVNVSQKKRTRTRVLPKAELAMVENLVEQLLQAPKNVVTVAEVIGLLRAYDEEARAFRRR